MIGWTACITRRAAAQHPPFIPTHDLLFCSLLCCGFYKTLSNYTATRCYHFRKLCLHRMSIGSYYGIINIMFLGFMHSVNHSSSYSITGKKYITIRIYSNIARHVFLFEMGKTLFIHHVIDHEDIP